MRAFLRALWCELRGLWCELRGHPSTRHIQGWHRCLDCKEYFFRGRYQ